MSKYLQNPTYAKLLVNGRVRVVDAEGVALGSDFLAAVGTSEQYGVILLEGRKDSATPLILQIRDTSGRVMVEQEFPVEIMPVEEMYGCLDLRSEAGGGSEEGAYDRYISRVSGHPVLQAIEGQPYCQRQDDRTLIWLYGYNVAPDAGRATYAEVFKRFFHVGFNGRFLGVSWLGDPPAPLSNVIMPPHYHQAVVNAFATAGEFSDFMNYGISGATFIAAHSLGNLVVGSAIQDHGLTKFDKYFAIDAAVALEAYGGVLDDNGQTVVDEGMLTVDDWKDYWDYETTDPTTGKSIYPNRKLFASEWYRLFPIDDKRSELTWRNRLDQVPSEKVYNFYSSTEEVLRQYPGDDIAHVKDLWQTYQEAGNLKGIVEYLSMSTWVKQEKFKGRKSFFDFDYFGGVASPFSGWSFNHYWYLPDPYENFEKTIKPTPADVSSIDSNELIAHPFFDPSTNLFGMSMAELVSSSGSAFVDEYIGNTPLKDYYTNNSDAQRKVKMKEWLLAEAFPATTLPMGANSNLMLTIRGQNIDMSGDSSEPGVDCCKTSEGAWPRKEEGTPVWWHGDYKDVPFQDVREFYNKIKDLSEK